MLVTFTLVVFGWIIFRAESISQIGEYISQMCSSTLFTIPQHAGIHALFLNMALLVGGEWISRNKQHGLSLEKVPTIVRYIVYLVFAFILFAFGGQTVNFIYFQF
jgi:ABC-type xylose transport system permease subunit